MIVRNLTNVLLALSLGAVYAADFSVTAFAKDSKAETKKSAGSQKSTSSENNETGIKAQLSVFGKTLADGDASKLAAMWTADGDYTDISGNVSRGKSELEKRFSEVLSSGKQYVELLPDSIKFLSPGVALAEGVVRRRDGVDGPTPETRFSMAFVNQAGNWLISSATETPLVARNSEPLSDLSFLIGEWSAENNGGYVHMKADWAANKHFITCNYQVKKSPDAPVQESKQVIGWDPRTEQPISWHFDANGGFGFGNWVKKDKQWLVDATGIDHDGSTSNATNVISITDKDNFQWQSVNRNVNGIAFNDSESLKVHRVSK